MEVERLDRRAGGEFGRLREQTSSNTFGLTWKFRLTLRKSNWTSCMYVLLRCNVNETVTSFN